MVVQSYVAKKRLLQVLSTVKAMGLENISDAPLKRSTVSRLFTVVREQPGAPVRYMKSKVTVSNSSRVAMA